MQARPYCCQACISLPRQQQPITARTAVAGNTLTAQSRDSREAAEAKRRPDHFRPQGYNNKMNETLKHEELKAKNPFARFQNALAWQLEAGSFRLQAAERQPIEWGGREVRFDSEFEVLQERIDYLDNSEPTADSLGSEEEEIRDVPEQIFSCRTKRVANAMKEPISNNQPKPILYSKLREVDPDVQLLYDVDEDIVFY